jgi:hypothetical protein
MNIIPMPLHAITCQSSIDYNVRAKGRSHPEGFALATTVFVALVEE